MLDFKRIKVTWYKIEGMKRQKNNWKSKLRLIKEGFIKQYRVQNLLDDENTLIFIIKNIMIK